jgi:hypothetical protein
MAPAFYGGVGPQIRPGADDAVLADVSRPFNIGSRFYDRPPPNEEAALDFQVGRGVAPGQLEDGGFIPGPELAQELELDVDRAGKGADLLEGEFRIAEGTAGAPAGSSEYTGTVTVPLEEGNVTFVLTPVTRAAGERHAFRIEISGLEAAARHAMNSVGERRHRLPADANIPSPVPPEPPLPASPSGGRDDLDQGKAVLPPRSRVDLH